MNLFSSGAGFHILTARTPSCMSLQRVGGAIFVGTSLRTLVCKELLPEKEEDTAFEYVVVVLLWLEQDALFCRFLLLQRVPWCFPPHARQVYGLWHSASPCLL